MQRFVDWVKRNLPALLAVGLLVLAVLVIGPLPSWLTRHPWVPKSVDRHKAIADARNGLVALGASAGVTYTARTYRLTRTGQITDRYAKAIELLGSDTRNVRIGGIFALERIMGDSPDDQPTIVEVLTVFIREHAPWRPRRPFRKG